MKHEFFTVCIYSSSLRPQLFIRTSCS